MPYSVTCSTDNRNFFVILVGIFCGFAMVPVVYILLSPQEREFFLTAIWLPQG